MVKAVGVSETRGNRQLDGDSSSRTCSSPLETRTPRREQEIGISLLEASVFAPNLTESGHNRITSTGRQRLCSNRPPNPHHIQKAKDRARCLQRSSRSSLLRGSGPAQRAGSFDYGTLGKRLVRTGCMGCLTSPILLVGLAAASGAQIEDFIETYARSRLRGRSLISW